MRDGHGPHPILMRGMPSWHRLGSHLEFKTVSDAAETVVAIERGFWTQADDSAYFTTHMADGGLSVLEPMGFVEKRQAVESVAPAPWTDVEMLDLQVRQLTPDCVILAYHGRGRQVGQAKAYEGSIASTYCLIAGEWKLAITAHQPWSPKG
jgi:hypothetical protein